MDLQPGQCVKLKSTGESTCCVLAVSTDGNLKLRDVVTRELRQGHISDYEFTVPPEHNFRLPYATWEYVTFCNASHFSAAVMTGVGKFVTAHFTDFADAVAEARKHKAVIYVIAASGRAFPLGRIEWDKWLQVWNDLPGNKGATALDNGAPLAEVA